MLESDTDGRWRELVTNPEPSGMRAAGRSPSMQKFCAWLNKLETNTQTLEEMPHGFRGQCIGTYQGPQTKEVVQ